MYKLRISVEFAADEKLVYVKKNIKNNAEAKKAAYTFFGGTIEMIGLNPSELMLSYIMHWSAEKALNTEKTIGDLTIKITQTQEGSGA